MKQYVVVMRHGERRDNAIDAPLEGDPPLTAEGKEAVAPVVAKLGEQIGFDVVQRLILVSSPFMRTMETAEELLQAGLGQLARVGPYVDNTLCEVFGPSRIKTNEVPTLNPRYTKVAQGSLPKWGESIEMAANRYVESFLRIADAYPKDHVLLVTHGDAISAILSHFYPMRVVYEAQYLSYIVMERSLGALEKMETTHSSLTTVAHSGGSPTTPVVVSPTAERHAKIAGGRRLVATAEVVRPLHQEQIYELVALWRWFALRASDGVQWMLEGEEAESEEQLAHEFAQRTPQSGSPSSLKTSQSASSYFVERGILPRGTPLATSPLTPNTTARSTTSNGAQLGAGQLSLNRQGAGGVGNRHSGHECLSSESQHQGILSRRGTSGATDGRPTSGIMLGTSPSRGAVSASLTGLHNITHFPNTLAHGTLRHLTQVELTDAGQPLGHSWGWRAITVVSQLPCLSTWRVLMDAVVHCAVVAGLELALAASQMAQSHAHPGNFPAAHSRVSGMGTGAPPRRSPITPRSPFLSERVQRDRLATYTGDEESLSSQDGFVPVAEGHSVSYYMLSGWDNCWNCGWSPRDSSFGQLLQACQASLLLSIAFKALAVLAAYSVVTVLLNTATRGSWRMVSPSEETSALASLDSYWEMFDTIPRFATFALFFSLHALRTYLESTSAA